MPGATIPQPSLDEDTKKRLLFTVPIFLVQQISMLMVRRFCHLFRDRLIVTVNIGDGSIHNVIRV